MTLKERAVWGLLALAAGVILMTVLPHEYMRLGMAPVFIYLAFIVAKGNKKKNDRTHQQNQKN